jgi:hypothetical protein
VKPHQHKRRKFTAEEDAVILRWCRGEIGLFACMKQIKSSVPSVKNRASYLCAGELNLEVPYHRPNKDWPKSYLGKEGPPEDTSNYTLTVGKDKYLERLNRGLR